MEKRPWISVEELNYNIKIMTEDGDVQNIGKWVLKINENKDEIKFNNCVTINEQNIDESILIADRKKLIPIEGKVIIHLDEEEVVFESKYSSRKINLISKSKSGTRSRKLKNEENVYDNIQMYQLIRCIDFSQQKEYVIKSMDIRDASVKKYYIKYEGEETVCILNKEYSCFRISISEDNDRLSRQFVIYSNDIDRKMIKCFINNQLVELLDIT